MADISKDLSEQVAAANAKRKPLKITGGGTKQFMGRQTEGDCLHLSDHNGVVTYEPTELVMTARAGTRIRDLQHILAANHQQMAFEPPAFDGLATLGGTLACNVSGPARPWSGSIRDAVLGVRLINGRGEHLKFGGQVMKNVAGYDLSRLQAGAMGSLGVVTEVSFKVLPRPAATVWLVQELSAANALALMTKMRRQAMPLTGACWFAGQLMWRLAGAKSAVAETAAKLGGELMADGETFWHELTEQRLHLFTSGLPLWRFSLSPAATTLPVSPPANGQLLIDWAGAQRWLAGAYSSAELQAIARAAAGHVSLYRGGDRGGEVFQQLPEAVRNIHQRLKQALDPNAVLNPGRLYSWL